MENNNELMFWLGSGWYTKGLPGVAFNGPVVRAQLENVEKNKREIILVTDSSWVVRKSCYTRHGDWRAHRFGGEVLDGNLVIDAVSYSNNSEWKPVSIVKVPVHTVSPQMVELNRF